MKLVYPDIGFLLDTEEGLVNTLVIENQSLFCSLLNDLHDQLSGLDGRAVLSVRNNPVEISKRMELLTTFVPFELNQKTLLAKITAELEKEAVGDVFYPRTLELLSALETYLNDLAFGYSCDLAFTKLNLASILKAVGVEIRSDGSSLGEKLVDYFELVTEFIGAKLFVTVNLRSFMPDRETELFLDTVLKHGYNLIMLESSEHNRLSNEKRYIVDTDLCEIC